MSSPVALTTLTLSQAQIRTDHPSFLGQVLGCCRSLGARSLHHWLGSKTLCRRLRFRSLCVGVRRVKSIGLRFKNDGATPRRDVSWNAQTAYESSMWWCSMDVRRTLHGYSTDICHGISMESMRKHKMMSVIAVTPVCCFDPVDGRPFLSPLLAYQSFCASPRVSIRRERST